MDELTAHARGTAADCEREMRRLTDGERGCANPAEHRAPLARNAERALWLGALLGAAYIAAHVVAALTGLDLFRAAAAVAGFIIAAVWLAAPFLGRRKTL